MSAHDKHDDKCPFRWFVFSRAATAAVHAAAWFCHDDAMAASDDGDCSASHLSTLQLHHRTVSRGHLAQLHFVTLASLVVRLARPYPLLIGLPVCSALLPRVRFSSKLSTSSRPPAAGWSARDRVWVSEFCQHRQENGTQVMIGMVTSKRA